MTRINNVADNDSKFLHRPCSQIYRRTKFIRASRLRLKLTLTTSAEMYSIGEFDERYPIGRRIMAEVWRMCHPGWER